MALGRKNFGFTMIELLIVVATIGILGAMAIFAAKSQIAKGRDARRKSDLAKIQKALEDYMNDHGCYPDSLECGTDFSPYLTAIPCDPINSSYFNYFYSYNAAEGCKSWYKIYARLEYPKDPIIKKVKCGGEAAGCPGGGCGPGCHYNYWVASPNMNKVEQTAGELWWPPVGGGGPTPTPTLTSTPTPTLPPGVTPTPTPTSTPTPTLPPGVTPTPTPTSTPTPTPDYNLLWYGCINGECVAIWGDCSTGNCQCPNKNYLLPDCGGQCVDPDNECR